MRRDRTTIRAREGARITLAVAIAVLEMDKAPCAASISTLRAEEGKERSGYEGWWCGEGQR
jgi:hypothetical protein